MASHHFIVKLGSGPYSDFELFLQSGVFKANDGFCNSKKCLCLLWNVKNELDI